MITLTIGVGKDKKATVTFIVEGREYKDVRQLNQFGAIRPDEGEPFIPEQLATLYNDSFASSKGVSVALDVMWSLEDIIIDLVENYDTIVENLGPEEE